MKNLDGAAENVSEEMRKLDEAGERCVEASVKAFQEVTAAVDRRRDDVIATVRRIRDDKKRVLREQLDIIESERRRVRADCDGLQASGCLYLAQAPLLRFIVDFLDNKSYKNICRTSLHACLLYTSDAADE